MADTGRGYARRMPRTRTSLGIGLSALASVGAAAYMTGRRAVPGSSGTVTLPCLQERVEVLRDRYGVAAVFAQSDADAYRIQGWLHATDRTFQLDLMRRVGRGRLAELVGEAGVASDRLVRTLGCHTHIAGDWKLLESDERAMFEAYAEGVNAGFERAQRRVPFEYRLLRSRPTAWEPADGLAIGRVLALGLSGNWESELARGELLARFGTEVVEAIDGDDGHGGWPAQLDPSVIGALIGAVRDATSSFGGPGGIGSNAWVVGPRRTRDGGALLANDPHLDLQMPSVWYEQRLSGGTLDVRGFTFPGVPGVVLGHNGRIAWGFTNSSIDVQDCYIEELDAEQRRYRDTDGDWHELERRVERIEIKGGRSIEFEVRATRRGPLLTDAVASSTLTTPVSLRWDSLRPGRASSVIHRLNRAGSWDAFRRACSDWLAPAQNVVYADIEGMIGLQHMGEVPIRAAGNDGSRPRAGSDPDGDWIGTIPWDEQPGTSNPAASRIVTANDRLVGDDYPHFLSREWMNGYRGERIRTLIDETADHTVGDQVRIQADVYSIPGAHMRDLLERCAPQPRTPGGIQLLELLLAWDGQVGSDETSQGWRLLQRAVQDEAFGFLGDLLPRFLGYSRTGMNGFWAMFGRSTPRLLAAIDADDDTLLQIGIQVEQRRANGEALPRPLPGWAPHVAWCDLLAAALDRAAELAAADAPHARRTDSRSLPRRIGNRLRLQHPLGIVPGVSRITNRGPFDVPGDPDTVWQSAPFNNPMNDHAMVGPSHRHVVDLADVDRSVAVLCGGQSGHPASPHYADQIELWRRGAVRPAPFTRPALERITRFRQTFVP